MELEQLMELHKNIAVKAPHVLKLWITSLISALKSLLKKKKKR